jgi:hypothetical protein
MRAMNKVKLVAAIVVFVLFAGFMSCAHATFLPRTELVNVTGTEVKRVDPTETDPTVHDRRYILARRLSDGEALSFLNEDTRWGWPWYLKFNSADVSAQAADIVRSQPEAAVLLKFYGFRSALLDEFPNVVSMKIVEKDHFNIPVFNILFYLVIFAAAGGAYYLYTRVRDRKTKTKKNDVPPPEPQPTNAA